MKVVVREILRRRRKSLHGPLSVAQQGGDGGVGNISIPQIGEARWEGAHRPFGTLSITLSRGQTSKKRGRQQGGGRVDRSL